MSDINDIILEASYILIDSELRKIAADTTLICTIVDNSEAKTRGAYQVTYNTLKYEVYAENKGYSVGEQVIVLFPADDNKNKTILSRYAIDPEKATLAYVEVDKKFAKSWILKELNAGKNSLGNISTQGCDAICIKADVQYEGSAPYKLKLSFTEDDPNPLTFGSEDFLGDPFNFFVPFRQEKIFPLQKPIETDLKNIYLSFDNCSIDNFENLEICFGKSTINKTNKSIELSLKEKEQSQYEASLIWYNKDEFDSNTWSVIGEPDTTVVVNKENRVSTISVLRQELEWSMVMVQTMLPSTQKM